jgi:hypothetical protein
MTPHYISTCARFFFDAGEIDSGACDFGGGPCLGGADGKSAALHFPKGLFRHERRAHHLGSFPRILRRRLPLRLLIGRLQLRRQLRLLGVERQLRLLGVELRWVERQIELELHELRFVIQRVERQVELRLHELRFVIQRRRHRGSVSGQRRLFEQLLSGQERRRFWLLYQRV